MNLNDLQTIRETRAFLLRKYNPFIHPVGWAVDQLARIHNLSQAQIYALDHLPDDQTLKLWDKLTDEVKTDGDFWRVTNES